MFNSRAGVTARLAQRLPRGRQRGTSPSRSTATGTGRTSTSNWPRSCAGGRMPVRARQRCPRIAELRSRITRSPTRASPGCPPIGSSTAGREPDSRAGSRRGAEPPVAPDDNAGSLASYGRVRWGLSCAYMSHPTERGITRRQFGALSAGALAAPLLRPGSGPQVIRRPPGGAAQGLNIVFLFGDQERFIPKLPPGLSLPGHERLQKTGVTFLNHYTSAIMCTPSRSVLMTGLQTADNAHVRQLRHAWVQESVDRSPDGRPHAAEGRLLHRLQGQVASQQGIRHA